MDIYAILDKQSCSIDLRAKTKDEALHALAAFAAMALAHMIPQERSLADILVGGYRFRDFTLQERILTQFRLLFQPLSLVNRVIQFRKSIRKFFTRDKKFKPLNDPFFLTVYL